MTDPILARHSVLLVDDDTDLLRSFQLTLRARGMERILTCSDPAQVPELVERHRPRLIVLDLMMPGLPGTELLPRLREAFPDIPIIILTALNDLQTAVQCMQLGAADYMVKPVERNRFVSGVQRLLELQELKEQNAALRRTLLDTELQNPQAFSAIITRSPQLKALFRYCEAVAPSMEPVLICGETGTGKELFARALHDLSGRGGTFLSVNVAGLDDNVFSDTLFGHRKGAFTDAVQDRAGLVEQAAGGTLCLDEIGDLSPASQIKLLRLLQEKEYYPLGSDVVRQARIRVICSTNRDLPELTAAGRFRNDLYYRLCTHQLQLPPLRRRLDDLPLLIAHFVREADMTGGGAKLWHPAWTTALQGYAFPGNVRELRAMVFDIVGAQRAGLELPERWRPLLGAAADAREDAGGEGVDFSSYAVLPTLEELENGAVHEALRRSNGNISGAARLLGINRQTLHKKLHKASS